MREVLRGSDLKCRYGGEEFLVLLPETPLEGAKRVADTLRRELADLPVGWKGEVVRVTASFGVSVAMPSEVDPTALIARADAALYRAKNQGRNCVRLSMDVASSDADASSGRRGTPAAVAKPDTPATACRCLTAQSSRLFMTGQASAWNRFALC